METLVLIALAFALGGILKGATGAGAPVLAVPLLALLYDVPFAVAVFIFPNFLTNSLQIFQHHQHIPSIRFVALLGVSGMLGGIVGTVMLANLTSDSLKLLVGAVVIIYIAFRLMRPDWTLSRAVASVLVAPVGFVAGILQAATGISAPVSVTFLNAMKLDRTEFIPTISVFFLALACVQLPLLMMYGFMDLEIAFYSLMACVPMVAAMPVGMFLVRHIRKTTFDRIILILLAILALRLLGEVLL